MARKYLLAHGGGIDPDDLVDASPEARSVAARYAIDDILASMKHTKNPLHWWEALRVCIDYRVEMPPEVAAYVLRVTEALFAGVGNVTPAKAERFIVEALELRPRGRKRVQVTCFRVAKADALKQVLELREEIEPHKTIAHEKNVSASQVSKAKAKFRTKAKSGKS
jgi:hypothetical protein